MPFPYLGEDKELNEVTRSGAEGSFITLSDGITHYELSGDPDKSTIVLVHGFSVPYFIFDITTGFLLRNGFRILRYDLFGRGLSDRPKTNYDIHLFVRQLKDLLDALDIKRVHLLGLSMGGVITASFIDQYPDHVEKYILIDPAGARSTHLSPMLQMAKIPIVSDLFFGLLGSEGLVKSIADDMFTPNLVKIFQKKYKVQMEYSGFKRAILSTIRNGMLNSFIDTYQRVGKLEKPTLLFWGQQDATVPFEHSADLIAAMPHTKFIPIDHCGHIPHVERPEVVHPELLEFISS